MDSRKLFFAGLVALLLLYFGYGLERFSLGVDLTDEGAYVSWPSRLRWGEPPFSSEVHTLTRPVEVYLGVVFRLWPGITLYEFRLLGWSLHLLAFAALASYLFRLTGAPAQSLLIASIPLFGCHILGYASPNYNTLSSDFLLLALVAMGLARLPGARRAPAWEIAGGLALFAATVAHPALGLVAGAVLLHELAAGNLVRNTLRGQPSAANCGLLAFAGAALLALVGLAANGALATWWSRAGLAQGAATALRGPVGKFVLDLVLFPLALNRSALTWAAAAITALVFLQILRRTRRDAAPAGAGLLGMVLVGSLVATLAYRPEWLHLRLALVGMMVIAAAALGLPGFEAEDVRPVRRLMLLSALGALVYASFTYYFSPVRSWTSGVLGLPFALGAGLALVFQAAPRLRVPANAMLLLAVACLVADHRQSIWRDSDREALQATSHIPRLGHIHSTPERMQSLDALYDHLHVRLNPGEPLLVYDDCPMLYFLLDARPAYGLAWASRFGVTPEVLAQLHRELLARPLPRYAVRTLVDVSLPVWAEAPRKDYRDYALNETVAANYELERTIFPFEIWRLKPPPTP